MSHAPSNSWPAASLASELRELNRQFMTNSADNILRGMDHWPNRQPERFTEELADAQKHGVAAISPDDAGFALLMNSGSRFNWAVLLDGMLRVSLSVVMTVDGPIRISHAILAPNGDAILAAGEGKPGAYLSNTTGHYKNEVFVLPPVRKAFESIGIFFKR